MTGLVAEVAVETSLDEVVFANVWLWPMFVLVPLVIAAYLWAGHQRRRAMDRLGNESILERLSASVHHRNRVLAATAMTIAVALLIAALLRPQYGGRARKVPSSGIDIILAVDYSKSMLAQDVYPTRSERLEAELSRFLSDANARGDRVGVVVFAGHARGFPLTRDTRMLDLYLSRADPKFEEPGGTAIGKALQLGLQFLIDARRPEDLADGDDGDDAAAAEVLPAPENEQVIVLLTDGEDTASRPLEVAQQAAKLGVRVYTVGIGSASGEPIPQFDEAGEPAGFVTDADGNYVMSRLDEGLLREIAKTTGGRFIHVEPKAFGLDEVRELLQDSSGAAREDVLVTHREEGFTFFLAPALALISLALALSDRRRRTA